MQLPELTRLNFCEKYEFRFKTQTNGETRIWDVLRKKYYKLTPEEWVRQHWIHFFIYTQKIPHNILEAEKHIDLLGTSKRADLVIYKKEKVFLTLECKAPQIKLSQEVFDQIARYNKVLDSEYLLVSNGKQHIYAKIDDKNKKYTFLKNLDYHLLFS